MATVVSITNPITGAVEQVDKLDHTAQQIDDAVTLAPQISNPNLLDNWYFGNPVNQRGETVYAAAAYGIDRWRLSNSYAKMEIVSDGVLLSANGGTAYFIHYLDIDIAGKTLTLSALVGGEVKSVTEAAQVGMATAYVQIADGCMLRLEYSSTKSMFAVSFSVADGKSVTVQAVKLELGTTQTIAHQDTDGNWVLNEIPDYGEQLARCQRYALALSKQSGHSVYGSGMINAGQNARIVVPLPVTMRTAPTVTKLGDLEILANGTTYVVTSVSVEGLSPTAVCIVANSTSLSTTQAATPALLRSSGGGKGELFLSADL